MKLNKRNIILLFIATFIIGFVGAYVGMNVVQTKWLNKNQLAIEGQSNIDIPKDISKISQTFSLIKEHYLEEVDDATLIEGAIQGMLETLDDPYSTYMDEEAMERFNEQIESSFQGIGAEVSMVEGKVTIIAPIKGSPAEKAGLRPNDQILRVDDEDLDGLDLNKAVEKIRGEKGSEVTLEVKRAGTKEPFKVKIVRDDIPIETVFSEIDNIDGKKTGIIEITSFSEQTATEFKERLNELEEKEIEGLIIDVRGNPGGLLESIEDILQSFIPKDVPYIQIEDQNGEKELFYTNLKEKKPYPINVIIDEGSASASEILAVAMKEVGYDIVGQTSFGKGTVQQAVPLGDGGMVKLTFYKWLSPEGNWINEKGVEPTVQINQPDYYYTHPITVEDEPFQFDDIDEQIKSAQIMLEGLGYNVERKDGYFDQKTVEAVKSFQRENGLKSTGKIDEETASKLATKIIDKIRSGTDDKQLEKAKDVLYK